MMNRRRFLSLTSSGLSATMIGPGMWITEYPEKKKQKIDFRPYRQGQTLVPVHQIVIDGGFYIHTFYDVCPWSPGGRYLVLTRLPYQEKKPRWGDAAEVCVIDLKKNTLRTVYETKAWAFQLGTNAQWNHHSDRYLYTNDIIGGEAVCVRIDLDSGEIRAYKGPKYDISPDGRMAAGPNLHYVNATQYGYSLPDSVGNAPNFLSKDQMDSEGLWITDLENNRKKMVASLNDFYRHAVPADRELYKDGTYYLFHTKYNSKSNRIMQVFRCLFDDGDRHASLFTL